MWCRVTQRSVWHDVCVVQLERRRALSKVEVSFDLVDDSGRIRVVPEKADMTGLGVLSEEGDWGHPLWSFGGASTISGSTGRRRFSESAVPVGAAVFVLGSARLQGASAVREIRRKLRRGWAGARGLFAASAAGAGTAAATSGASPDLWRIALAVGVVVVMVAALYLFSVYNALAVLAQTASFRQALAVAENYPQSKTSAAFQDLCRQIIDTESRLALTRQFFNEAVEALRNRLGQFPGVLFDRGARFPAGELFIANEFDRVVPPVAEAGQ